MFKSNKAKKIVAASVCVLTMGGMMLTGVANADAPETAFNTTGETTIAYDNRNAIAGNNGQYGFFIPSGITLTDKQKSADASISISGINNYKLSDWEKLEVKVTVKSENNYNLQLPEKSNNDPVPYKLTLGGQELKNSDTEGQELTQKLGYDSAAPADPNIKSAISGTAELTGKALKKGSHTDKLTFTFKEVQNTLN